MTQTSTPSGAAHSREGDACDLSELHDIDDREELRRRYEVLLQELRVGLPGVQVLLAFLLTTPFASGYERLDSFGRRLLAAAMLSALIAVASLLSPAMFHRVGRRSARRARLVWGIRMAKLGLATTALAFVSAMWCVARFAFGNGAAAWMAPFAAGAFIFCWLVLPLVASREYDSERDETGA